jgi:hypothetical protein
MQPFYLTGHPSQYVVVFHCPETEPGISIEYLEVFWHIAHAPVNGRIIYEQCVALQACVANLFDVPPAAFAINVQRRCMLAELLRCIADADVGVNMSLCTYQKLCESLEAYECALNSGADSFSSLTSHERCAKQVCLTLSKLLRCDHVELFRWIGAALASPAACLADKELALTLLTTSVEDENVRALLLARLAETQIVAGLWAVVCTPFAYGSLQVAACKVLNTLKLRVMVDALRALTNQIARIGARKSGRSHAIKAALELCEWTDNVAVMEQFFLDHHSALVAACRSASRADDRLDACKLVQTLSCWPGDDVLDSLARATGLERADTLRCVAQLARNVEFRFVLEFYLYDLIEHYFILFPIYPIVCCFSSPVRAWRIRVGGLSRLCSIPFRACPAGLRSTRATR